MDIFPPLCWIPRLLRTGSCISSAIRAGLKDGGQQNGAASSNFGQIRMPAVGGPPKMIRNGIYAYSATMLDGVLDGDGSGVTVLRDGALCGGNSFYYYIGSYSCSGGKWKGELTTHEHTPIFKVGPFARRIVTVGFSGT